VLGSKPDPRILSSSLNQAMTESLFCGLGGLIFLIAALIFSEFLQKKKKFVLPENLRKIKQIRLIIRNSVHISFKLFRYFLLTIL
jgi:hypothetical protein